MSDLWAFTPASAHPVIHHSSQTHSLPPFQSLPSFSNHRDLPPATVISPDLSLPQLSRTQVTLFQFPPPHSEEAHVTSPQSHPLLAYSDHLQETSRQVPLCSPRINSPHLSHPQLMSPHLPSRTSPSQIFFKSPVTSPQHLVPPQTHGPLHPSVASPHLTPQNLLYDQSSDPELDYSSWNGYESSDFSEFPGNGFSFQNQTTTELEYHLHAQNLFSTKETHREEMENPNEAFSGHIGDLNSWEHLTPPTGRDEPIWGCFMPTQQPHSPPGSRVPSRRWSSIDLNSFSAQDFQNSQTFHDDSAPQPFCSPNTPGPSPHYPQTPAESSPGPHLQPRPEKTQTNIQLNSDHGYECDLKEFDCYILGSDEVGKNLLPSQPEQGSGTGFSSCGMEQSITVCGPVLGAAYGGRRGGRRGRDGRPTLAWVQSRSNAKVQDSRLLCTVCNRDFRSLPALNGHMRSHSGLRTPTSAKKDASPTAPKSATVVMPVSVPVRSRGASSNRGLRRTDVLPVVASDSELYLSLMHLEEAGPPAQDGEVGGIIGGSHFTPPPMLRPRRPGPGLFCSLATAGQQRVQTVHLQNGLGSPIAMAGTATPVTVTPRINLGRSFQAEIPPLRDRKRTATDSHNALLLWTPWDKLKHPVNQQRVESLLAMARSSVVPVGGANPERVLSILSETRGDFLLTLDKLLMTPEITNKNCADVRWSPAEKRSLVKSVKLHQKDFRLIQKAVQTKTLSECVEFYYLWKKKLNLRARTQPGLTITLPNTNVQKSSASQEAT